MHGHLNVKPTYFLFKEENLACAGIRTPNLAGPSAELSVRCELKFCV